MQTHMQELLSQLDEFDKWLHNLQKNFSEKDSNVSKKEFEQRRREAECWLFSIYSKAYVNMQLVLKQEQVKSTLNDGLKSIQNCPPQLREAFRNSLTKAMEVLIKLSLYHFKLLIKYNLPLSVLFPSYLCKISGIHCIFGRKKEDGRIHSTEACRFYEIGKKTRFALH